MGGLDGLFDGEINALDQPLHHLSPCHRPRRSSARRSILANSALAAPLDFILMPEINR